MRMTDTHNPRPVNGITGMAFDAFLFSITVGIWGFILAMFALKWVMP